MKNRLVSVIIPTKNSAKTMDLCLKSIVKQSYSNIEIVVVDGYSDDITPDITEKYNANYIACDSERCTARNLGAEQSKGDFLCFIDSDMELERSVIEECITKMRDNDISSVIIPEISVGEGFWTNCKALERSCYIGDDTIEAARFFRREVFDEIHGYDENLISGEDWDLSQRAKATGGKCVRISSLIRHHEGKLSLLKTMKKKFYYSHFIKNYMIKNPQMAKKQLTFIRPAYIRNWKRLIRHPILTVGFMFMKTCEFAAAGVGIVLVRINDE
ncbi:glycosyltransferase [Methanococcoides sp. LMO-2]|uniref:Glycosyltransferase n=1 Tax=Methanococcoides cohabitans TaxID=3136559 RepID=A0ABU9KQ85_9EURY